MSCSHAAASTRSASAPRDDLRVRALGGDALDVGPATGKGVAEEGAGEAFGPGCDGLHRVHASQLGRDVHGRGLPSGDV